MNYVSCEKFADIQLLEEQASRALTRPMRRIVGAAVSFLFCACNDRMRFHRLISVRLLPIREWQPSFTLRHKIHLPPTTLTFVVGCNPTRVGFRLRVCDTD